VLYFLQKGLETGGLISIFQFLCIVLEGRAVFATVESRSDTYLSVVAASPRLR